jgi:hypothetical protein
MKKILFLLATIVLLGIPVSHAQVKVMRQPKQFAEPYDNTDVKTVSRDFVFKPWVVYSDRSDNKTYSTEDGFTVNKVLGFMDPFYVLDETKTRVHIVKVDDGALNLSDLTVSKHEDFGWVDKENMLLWERGITAQKTGMNRKVIVINTVEWAKSTKAGDESDIVEFYRKPDLTQQTGRRSQLFQIFYVYKTSSDKKSLLIGRTSGITDAKNAENEVVGWVDRLRLVFWDHRVAIEPNWQEEAVKERRAKGVKSMVFRDKPSAERFASSLTVDRTSVLWDSDPYEKRRKGDYKRFPYISKDPDNSIVHNGVWGSTFTAEGDVIEGDVKANVDRMLSQIVEKRRNINIVFVVDATSSMLPYFRPIALSVTSSINRLSQTKNNIRFGAVAYRDIAEGEYLVERIRLTSKYEDVTEWLQTVYSSAKNVNDRDDAEAVFYGLRDALRNTDLPANETNYVILIGDAGSHTRNDESQVGRDELTALLAGKNVNLMAFQVNHKGSQDFENFNLQVKDLMQASAFRAWKQEENTYRLFGMNMPPKLNKLGNTESYLEGSALAGKLVQSLPGKSISPYTLQEQLITFITKAEDDINNVISLLNDVKEGKGISQIAGNLEYKPALINILVQSGVSNEQLELLKKARFQFYTTGYSDLQPEGFTYPLYQTVLFINRLELGGIVSDISRLLQKKSGNEVRRHLHNTFLKILEEHLGEMGNENIGNKSMEEITRLLFGLPSTSRMLRDVRLDDILDPVRFSDDKLLFWVGEMEAKLTRLKKIQNSENYEQSFESNDEIYYWLAQDLLP